MDRPETTPDDGGPVAPAVARLSGSDKRMPEAMEARLRAVFAAARYHGIELVLNDFRPTLGEETPSPASLVSWLREQGLTAKAVMLKWRNLFRFTDTPPVVLLFRDGSAGILVGADAKRDIVWIKDPRGAESDPPVAVDQLRLTEVWTGEVIMVRRPRGEAEAEAPFNLAWLGGLVWQEKRFLRDISIGSLVLSMLAIVPPLLVMTVIDRVVAHHSMSTLILISTMLAVLTVYETLLNWGRRELVLVMSTRIDTKLNLHVFARLLALPLDFFERNQAGETIGRIAQVHKIREFLTGKLLTTALDSFTLVFLLPFLFWMEATLAWIVMVVAGLIALVIMAFLKPISQLISRMIIAEHQKASVMVETVQGMRTVKSLALEPQRRSAWDEKVAVAGRYRLAAGRLANWPQTIVDPMQLFISRGVIMVGVYLALQNTSGIQVGALIAFMMLSSRVTSPLVGMARLMEDFTEVRDVVGEVAAVLNNPTETKAQTDGMRPKFAGAVEFEDVVFTYPRAQRPALDHVNFSVPPGTMLGLVGKSGSGKSTITRLLQGINREYTGAVKIDGSELRELNLTHLRRSFGVVLQDNFLFRGTVRDNITAGRPGLTLEDVVRAARLAGAEEFIERMPQGYETWIEEGSANISGGQRQGLAIARALSSDPRIMILDEATSALDPESEALVNANLQRIGKGRTMVIVSHRLSSLVDCNLILVMDKGRVLDVAPHAVLLERCSVYRQLWKQQTRHMGDPSQRPDAVMPVLAQGE